ncbi:RNA polymerase sigma factor [Gymnodinialimonas ulvae]|uniref:RNA polymerase sigma factor n=1 Tax=Gymnodinialimonas ulvae TaxID=3126504 RepID=UPI003097B5E5
MDVSDEDLALAAAGGDATAFELLLGRVYDRLFALCFRLTGSRAEAEDLTQDICLALPGKLAGFRGDAKVTTWLYRVAVNAASDRRRRAASYARATEGWSDIEIDRTRSAIETAEAHDWLTRAMAVLSPTLRDTLALVLDGITQVQAAEILGVSEGTIAWRVAEAKRKLRDMKALEEAGP